MKKNWLYTLVLSILVIVVGLVLYYFIHNQKDQDIITLYGNVDVRQVDIGFRVPGLVTELLFEEGDYVKQGELMATLDKQPYLDEVNEAEANVVAIERSLANAEEILQRRVELVGEGGVSEEDYEDALSNRDVLIAQLKEAKASLGVAITNLEDTKRFAPTDGTILTRVREPGTVVLKSEPVYTLSVISPVWIRAYISEPNLGYIFPGMSATVYTDTKGGPLYKGHIGFISPVAEFTPKTVETTQLRTDLVYRLRIYVDNPDWGLKQGMPVTVQLHKDPEGVRRSRESAACTNRESHKNR